MQWQQHLTYALDVCNGGLEGKYTDEYLKETGKDAPRFTDEDLIGGQHVEPRRVDIDPHEVERRPDDPGAAILGDEDLFRAHSD